MPRARDAERRDDGRRPYFEIAQDDAGLWHWILWAENGQPMAQSAAPYQRRNNLTDALKRMLDQIGPQTKIVIAVGNGEH